MSDEPLTILLTLSSGRHEQGMCKGSPRVTEKCPFQDHHLRKISSWLGEFCFQGDLKNEHVDSSPVSLMNSLFRAIFQVKLLYKLDKLHLLGSLNNDCKVSSPVSPMKGHFETIHWVNLYWLKELCPRWPKQKHCSISPKQMRHLCYIYLICIQCSQQWPNTLLYIHFTLLAHASEWTCLPHYTHMFHCTSTLISI